MSVTGPGETHRATIEIDGPKTAAEIQECMDMIREVLRICGGSLSSQETVTASMAGTQPVSAAEKKQAKGQWQKKLAKHKK
jgi:hypothetical protein